MLKLFLYVFLWMGWGNQVKWETDMATAKKLAAEQHKMILLNFSGSDWCAPCIQMRREILNHPDFIAWANNHAILVNADFPRDKKNQLSKSQQELNNKLADQYNANGTFPLTLLLNHDGTVIKSWEGNPKKSAAAFIQELNPLIKSSQQN
ncbi:MAG: thioredoxin family protein [Bacteroidota bacterium]|jgi:thioredoxin-related protein